MSQPSAEHDATLTGGGIRRGMRQMAPLGIFTGIFGLAFGVTAVQAGLGPIFATVMSTLVFAGASQFVAVDMWHAPLPILTILIATFAVNARMILMSATLYPWLRGLPPAQRYAISVFVADANWAAAMAAHARGERDVGIFVGGGITAWSTWILGTAIGVALGGAIESPMRYGIDVVMLAFFAVLLIGMARNGGRAVIWPWAVAAAVALLASEMIPGNWYIVIGAVAGGLTEMWRHHGV